MEGQIIKKSLGARKLKGLKSVVKVGYGCQCVRQVNLGFLFYLNHKFGQDKNRWKKSQKRTNEHKKL